MPTSRRLRPTSRKIRAAIDHLGTRNWFVTLLDARGGFVQVAWGTEVNLRDGDFLLETRGDHVEGHLSTVVTSFDEVHAVRSVRRRRLFLDGSAPMAAGVHDVRSRGGSWEP